MKVTLKNHIIKSFPYNINDINWYLRLFMRDLNSLKLFSKSENQSIKKASNFHIQKNTKRNGNIKPLIINASIHVISSPETAKIRGQ
jgi:hypothetical protein